MGVAIQPKPEMADIDRAVDRLRLRAPRIVYDLPAGGKRLVQRTEGIEATIVSGAVVYRGGEATGALPGRVVRGERAG